MHQYIQATPVDLTPHEQNVLRWLMKSGPLERVQVTRMLKTGGTSEKESLDRLFQFQYVQSVSNGRFVAYRGNTTIDWEYIYITWAFLAYIEDPKLVEKYMEKCVFRSMPKRVLFLRNNTVYQIVSVNPQELYALRSMEMIQDMKVIFVVPDVSIVEQVRLPNTPCMFCTVSKTISGRTAPKIKFYQ